MNLKLTLFLLTQQMGDSITINYLALRGIRNSCWRALAGPRPKEQNLTVFGGNQHIFRNLYDHSWYFFVFSYMVRKGEGSNPSTAGYGQFWAMENSCKTDLGNPWGIIMILHKGKPWKFPYKEIFTVLNFNITSLIIFSFSKSISRCSKLTIPSCALLSPDGNGESVW